VVASTGRRIKRARDRGGQIYDIVAKNPVMNGEYWPLNISDYLSGQLRPHRTAVRAG
jgi:hypothetical protein